MKARPGLLRALIVLVIAAGAVAVAFNREQIDLASIEAAISELGLWAPLGHLLLFALGTVLFVPGSIFDLASGLAGGLAFGPLWGSLVNLAGATLGATTGFLAARYVAGDWVRRKAGDSSIS